MLRITETFDLTLHEKRPFFTAEFRKAFAIALVFHLFFLCFFHVCLSAPEERLLPLMPVKVEVDLGPKVISQGHVLELPIFAFQSHSSPALPDFPTPQISFSSPDIEASAGFDFDFSSIDLLWEEDPLSFAKSFHPVQIFVGGDLSQCSFSQDTAALLEMKISSEKSTCASRFRYRVEVDEKTGGLLSWDLEEAYGETALLEYVEELLSQIHFEGTLADPITEGILEICLQREEP